MSDPTGVGRVLRGRSGSPSTSSPQSKKCTVSTCLSSSMKPLKCYECAAEYHSSCINMKVSVYKMISDSATAGVRWHCPKCLGSPSSRSVTSLMKNFDDFKNSMQAGLQAISHDVENQLKSFKDSIMESCEAYQNTSTKVSESITTYASALNANINQQSKTVEVVNELKMGVQELSDKAENEKLAKSELELRNFKKNNVMLFKLPESSKDSPTKAYEEDFINTMNVIDPEKKLRNTDIIKLYRTGGKESARPRPVVIRFKSFEKRNEVLKMEKFFHKPAGSEKVRVYVAPDRTKMQREDHKRLVDELNRRKEAGEDDLKIQNGKIVHLQSFRFNPKSFFKLRDNETTTEETTEETPGEKEEEQ